MGQILRELHLQTFRNIREATLLCDPLLTVIAGPNGQGKTNLLEAVWLLTGAKSFRTSKDFELVLQGMPFARLAGRVWEDTEKKQELNNEINHQLIGDKNVSPLKEPQKGQYEKEIELQIFGRDETTEKKGRFAQVNGVDYGRATAIAGIFMAVVFEPNHLSLVKGSPEGRRRFLDAALCQLYPGYIGVLRRFVRATAQKNALLRKYSFFPDADRTLDAYDLELAVSGGEITRRRTDYLNAIGPLVERYYEELTHGKEQLSLRFLPCCTPEELPELLAAARARDIRAGFCTAGPQREDFETEINGKNARTYGSQGQQRSVVLSLKLAEATRTRQVTGAHPVMLLDDVLSELDTERQDYLLQEMQGRQTIVTTCDEGAFARAAGRVVRVNGGVLKQ